jgi:NTP pyrophosphatase (non-canonical NTP hydrolase)
MITQEDIDAMGMSYYDPSEPFNYSEWVEGKIITEGQTRLVENVLGLVGEAGEVAEKIKKKIRDESKIDPEDIILELGDVVFYVTALANFYNYNLQSVIDFNVSKLDSREARGTLQGSGDNR